MTQWGLDTLFNPAKRHMDDEKRRLQSTREEVGDNSGGRRIDLESGKVVIRRGDDDADAVAPDEAAAEAGAGADPRKPTTTKAPAARHAPSAAAQRAAARRGRTAR